MCVTVVTPWSLVTVVPPRVSFGQPRFAIYSIAEIRMRGSAWGSIASGRVKSHTVPDSGRFMP
jgi:hypothetical protein